MVTEPDTESDTSRLTTGASKRSGGWVVNGQKVWITQALAVNHSILLARTGEVVKRFGGVSLLLADMRSDEVSISPIPKLPHNAMRSCQVFLTDLEIPDSRLIGEESWSAYLTPSTRGGRGAAVDRPELSACPTTRLPMRWLTTLRATRSRSPTCATSISRSAARASATGEAFETLRGRDCQPQPVMKVPEEGRRGWNES